MPTRRRARALFGSGLGLGIVAVLAPKCPLCIAGWLTLFGLGTATASALAPWLVPSVVALAVVALACGLCLAVLARR